MGDDFIHHTHIDGGHYNASWRGDTHVPYVCAVCGYRADAVAFLEARGASTGVGASPDAAERDAMNRAYEQLLAVVHAIPCPQCGRHDAQVLAEATESAQRNVRNRRMRRLLALVAWALAASAIALVVTTLAVPLPWWVALIGGALLPVVLIVVLSRIAYLPSTEPMVLPTVPANLRFAEPARELPFR